MSARPPNIAAGSTQLGSLPVLVVGTVGVVGIEISIMPDG